MDHNKEQRSVNRYNLIRQSRQDRIKNDLEATAREYRDSTIESSPRASEQAKSKGKQIRWQTGGKQRKSDDCGTIVDGA